MKLLQLVLGYRQTASPLMHLKRMFSQRVRVFAKIERVVLNQEKMIHVEIERLEGAPYC
jgi:hypothetical protein